MLGLTDEGWEVLNKIWSIQYMGAAEYEFSALPNALIAMSEIAEKGNLGVFYMEIEISKVDHYRTLVPSYRRDSKLKGEAAVVWIIGEKSKEKDYVEEIKKVAAHGESEFKERPLFGQTLLYDYLNGDWSHWQKVEGWVDISNNFMIFVDKDMCDQTFKVLFS